MPISGISRAAQRNTDSCYNRQMADFQLISDYQPMGDQPKAIDALVRRLEDGAKEQVLLGVTGSGKTFTMANVIQTVQKPTLVLSHNKTLAAQLYNEFKKFFPDNAVCYFSPLGHTVWNPCSRTRVLPHQ